MGRVGKHKIKIILVSTIFLLLFCTIIGLMLWNDTLHKKKAAWSPDGLKVELLEQAYGINTVNPGFSWYMNSTKNNSAQKKYHLVIATSQEKMKHEDYLIDTGWCVSDKNTDIHVEDIENKLEDNSLYYWKVAVEDTRGKKSLFSCVQEFSTKVGSQWASTDGIWDADNSDYAFVRSRFQIQNKMKDIDKAILNVTALSPEETKQYVYSLYLNESYIGSGPSRINGDNVNYNTYDVTKYLKQDNVLGAICYSNKDHTFLCQLTLYYSDGTSKIILNSGRDKDNWKVLNGNAAYGENKNVVSTSYYVQNAENINASSYPNGWLKKNFDDRAWKSAVVSKTLDQNHLYPYQSENMKKYFITPTKVEYKGNGHYFIDMGKEIVGGIAIQVYSGNINPTEITFRYGEELDIDGNVKYQMRTGNVYEEKWKLTGGKQNYENFGMKAFRYIDVYESNIVFSKDNIQGVAIRQAFDAGKSYFSSSNNLLNQLYDLTKYTVEATNQNLYVDSQSRERAAYEGDAWINMLASYAFEDRYTLARVSNEYLYANRTWPAEYPMYSILCAWQDYMYTGNQDSLRENYSLLKQKADNIVVDQDSGLIKNNYDEQGYNAPLVDWPGTERDNYAYDTAEYNTVFNCVVYGALERMSMIAKAIGQTEESVLYAKKSEALKQSMIKYLYDDKQGAFCDGLTSDKTKINHFAQHATAYALYFSIYDSDIMKAKLLQSIESTGQIKCSVFSSLFLLQGLYNSDAGDYATKLMIDDDLTNQHTWAYMLRKENATITTEAWSTQIKDNMTYSHPWGAAPASLIVQGMFGIKPIKAGFDQFEIKLQPGNIESASIKVPTIKGPIEASYKSVNKSGINEVTVTIPSNTTADVLIPDNNMGTSYLLVNEKENSSEKVGMYDKIILNSGTYTIKLVQDKED